ncbi:MAG: DMT family transporter [Theionarchaea archaeon]|nr:DMT family transporter [Theionarchaea archaeon]MBU7037380.1 DMT family transporter [Theionarchaea archaeon]
MLSPRLALLTAICAVSSASILIRMSEAPPLVIATYRLGIASMCMVVLAVGRGQIHQLFGLGKRDMVALILSGFFLYVHFATWITSLFYTTVATSVIIVDSSPLFVAGLSYVFLKETLSGRAVAGIIISMIGAVLIGLNNPVSQNMMGILLALVGAVGLAGYLVIGRDLRRNLDTFSYVSGVYCISFGFLLVTSLGFGHALTGYSVWQYVVFAALGVVSSGLGHTLYNYCLKYLKAGVVSVAILGEPVGATLLAVMFLKEVPTLLIGVGGTLVIVGIYLVIKK